MSKLRESLVATREEALREGEVSDTFLALLDTAIEAIDAAPEDEVAAVENIISASFARSWARMLDETAIEDLG